MQTRHLGDSLSRLSGRHGVMSSYAHDVMHHTYAWQPADPLRKEAVKLKDVLGWITRRGCYRSHGVHRQPFPDFQFRYHSSLTRVN